MASVMEMDVGGGGGFGADGFGPQLVGRWRALVGKGAVGKGVYVCVCVCVCERIASLWGWKGLGAVLGSVCEDAGEGLVHFRCVGGHVASL